MAKKQKSGKKRGGMPVDPKAVMEIMGDLNELRGLPAYVSLVLDVTASDQLIDAVLEAFTPVTGGSNVTVRTALLTQEVPPVPMPCDLCLVVAGDSLLVGNAAAAARKMGCPTSIVIQAGETFFAESAEDARELSGQAGQHGLQSAAAVAPVPEPEPIPLDTIVEVDFSLQRPLDDLGLWIFNNAPAKRASLAEYFPFMRWPMGQELTRLVALKNAAVGLVFIVPGADMPVITLNQIKLVLQIAGIYGEPLDMGRAVELAAVVAGAFGFRALARELTGAVPVLGWGIKSGIAYTGTLTMGQAALEYFDEGGRINGLARVITSAIDELTQSYTS